MSAPIIAITSTSTIHVLLTRRARLTITRKTDRCCFPMLQCFTIANHRRKSFCFWLEDSSYTNNSNTVGGQVRSSNPLACYACCLPRCSALIHDMVYNNYCTRESYNYTMLELAKTLGHGHRCAESMHESRRSRNPWLEHLHDVEVIYIFPPRRVIKVITSLDVCPACRY